ncbi:MAG: apolipoprotein N-acyltransferase [bacterium]|nr:apolipoprotein N-acyltransferase [bacterium]
MTPPPWAPRALLAFAAGALWAFCFGREPLLIAPWLALVPLLLLLAGPRPGLIGWFHGLGFWIVGISWIPATLHTFGSLPAWLAMVALLLVAAYLGLFHALFARLSAALWKRSGALALVALPAIWVVCEFLRGRGPAGFSWNLAGYSAAGLPGALETSAWIGALGVSALVVVVNVAFARAIVTRSWTPAAWTVLAVLALVAVSGRQGEALVASGPVRAVVLVQPNIPNMTSWDAGLAERNYRSVFERSRDACAPGELLIWPESAAWPYSFKPGSRLERDVAELVAAGCSLLFNSPFQDGERYYNAVLLESAGGSPKETGRYDKQRLVPFGEYVPLGRWLPFLERIARAAGDFSPGGRKGNLKWRGESLGTAICFEVTFPEDVAGKVARGASLLVTVTNDAWYGDTWAPWQHLRAAQFRAAENRRPLLRAAITGVSAVIGSRGELRQILGVNQEGVLRASVVGGESLSLYSRAPFAVPLLALGIGTFAILHRLARSRRGSG